MTRDLWDALEHPSLFSCPDVHRNVPNVTTCKEIQSKSSMLQFHTDNMEIVKFDPEMRYWSDKIIFGELIKPKDDYQRYEKMINSIEGCKVLDTHPHHKEWKGEPDEMHMHFICHENNETKSNAQIWDIIKINKEN